MGHAADEVAASGAPDDVLVARVLDQADEGGAEALSELVGRAAPGLPDLLIRVARDRTFATDLRVMAVGALDRVAATPDIREALRLALEDDEPAIAGRAAGVLGRVGDAAALEWLARPRKEPALALATLTARRLITYRLRLADELLPSSPPSPPLKPSADAVEMPRRPVDAEEAHRALAELHPGVDLAADGVLAITCGRSELWLVRNAALGSRESIKTLGARSAVLMVIVKRHMCPTTVDVDAYVLSHPQAGGPLTISIMRAGGAVTHFGSGRIVDDGLAFSLQALDTTHAYALQLDGHFRADDRVCDIERALVDTRPVRGQKAASVPMSDNE